MIKLRSNINPEVVVYFRFFSDEFKDKFWFTKTTDSCGFDLGYMKNFEPINTTWEKICNGNA